MSDDLPIKEILVGLFSFVSGAVVVAVLWARNYALRPRKATILGVEYDITRFKDLTHVRFLTQVTVALPVSAEPVDPSMDSATLIYAGWTEISEAFIRRFRVYPTDENVMKVVDQIGGQNAEFIIGYRKVQESAVGNPRNIPRQYAVDVAGRAPSLAQRIDPGRWPSDRSLVADLLRQ